MSGKGRMKTQKQDSACSEDGRRKNEYLTLWEGEMWCTVTCGARGKGRCGILSCLVCVITISQDLILQKRPSFYPNIAFKSYIPPTFSLRIFLLLVKIKRYE